MTLSFMIKKKYLAQKIEEQEETGIFHERRAYKPFWRTRIGSTHAWHLGGDAVFLCGRYAFMADIRNITIGETPPGIEDVVDGSLCYNIECKFLSSELEGLSTFLTD
jgi:hypothetical protein